MKINVITAPVHQHFSKEKFNVFLAGGICNCENWQKYVIDYFTSPDLGSVLNFDEHIYLLNPRRADWLKEEGEDVRQIEWEFDMIENCDIFSMYFAGGDSDQPICMYELGRNIERMKQRFPDDWEERIVITCDKGYKRLKDVIVQVKLATDGKVTPDVYTSYPDSINNHCYNIVCALQHFNKV